jgi:hypothetical protein
MDFAALKKQANVRVLFLNKQRVENAFFDKDIQTFQNNVYLAHFFFAQRKKDQPFDGQGLTNFFC